MLSDVIGVDAIRDKYHSLKDTYSSTAMIVVKYYEWVQERDYPKPLTVIEATIESRQIAHVC